MSENIKAEDRLFLWRCIKYGDQMVEGAATYQDAVVKPMYPDGGWGCHVCNPIGSGRYEVVCELTDVCPKCKSANINAECEVEQQTEGPIAKSGISYECAECGHMFDKPLKIKSVLENTSHEEAKPE